MMNCIYHMNRGETECKTIEWMKVPANGKGYRVIRMYFNENFTILVENIEHLQSFHEKVGDFLALQSTIEEEVKEDGTVDIR